MAQQTMRQRILKITYPFWVIISKLTGKNSTVVSNKENIKPATSIYDLTVVLNNGKELLLNEYRGKKILIVNTASNCGYTAQYADLQKLCQRTKEKLAVIGFPANDFKQQEKGTDEEIAQFCQINFGVSFPLAKKTGVKKKSVQHPVFEWLSHKELNGWNDKGPTWNFSKYLINEEGMLTHYFDPSISPLSEKVLKAIHI
jgi:glutathione peroxidase